MARKQRFPACFEVKHKSWLYNIFCALRAPERRRERAPAVCMCMRALASCASRRHAPGSALQGAAAVCARARRRRRARAAVHYAATCRRSEVRGLAACEALPLQCAAACAAVRTTPPRSCTAAGAAITSACCCWAGAPRLCRTAARAPRCAAQRDGGWVAGAGPPPLLLVAAGASSRARSTSSAHSPRGVPPPPPSRAAARAATARLSLTRTQIPIL